MKIKKYAWKIISCLLIFMAVLNNLWTANAADSNMTEWVADEKSFEDIEVTYNQSAVFFVNIPKRITLGEDKKAAYSVRVSGNIDKFQIIYVKPVDRIDETSEIDFYMKDLAAVNKKADVVATVKQDKIYWDCTEAANGYEKTDNFVSAPELVKGKWRGVFSFEIYSHEHYYADGVCESCGMAHNHTFVDTVTRKPTCAVPGELTHTCECGYVYTEEIPTLEHNFEDENICIDCGYTILTEVVVSNGDETPGNNLSEYNGDIYYGPSIAQAYEAEHFLINKKYPVTILSEGGSITVQNYYAYSYSYSVSVTSAPILYKRSGDDWIQVETGTKTPYLIQENYKSGMGTYTFHITEPGIYAVSIWYRSYISPISAMVYGWGPVYYSTSGYK